MRIEIDPKFAKKIRGKIEKHAFEVGILKDGPHRLARRGKRGLGGRDVIGTYAGGPIRKASRVDSGMTVAEVSKANRDRSGVNYLTEPFQKKNSEILKFAGTYLKYIFKMSQARRLENLLQAIVRNPILRGEYGTNSPFTQKVKGFNRYMIDTGQLFKAIRARLVKNV